MLPAGVPAETGAGFCMSKAWAGACRHGCGAGAWLAVRDGSAVLMTRVLSPAY